MENYDRTQIMRMKREALGYTRKEICEHCNGIQEKTLIRVEQGRTVRRESIWELLKFYHQSSHTIYPVMDLEKPSMAREQNEVLELMFHGNYKEAGRRQRYVESYMKDGAENTIKYSEVIGREIAYYIGEGDIDRRECVSYFEEQIAKMIPEGADLEKWPLNKKELHIYLAYFNVLEKENQYDKIILIARKLLLNIERQYHNKEIFVNYYICLMRRLIRCLYEQNQFHEVLELVRRGMEAGASVGDISDRCRIQYELLNYYWKNNFFDDDRVKEQCLETAENGYYLSKVCGDQKGMKEFQECLKMLHNNMGEQMH